MLEKNISQEEIKSHYELVRDNEKEVVRKLNANLGFYTFRPLDSLKEKEVMFDTADERLFSVGIILSKQMKEGKFYFKIRRVSKIKSHFLKPTQKIEITNGGKKASPKTFAVQIAQTIDSFFPNTFSSDLTEIIKRVVPKIEIVTKGESFGIAGGTGFKGSMVMQKVSYKSLITKRKIKKKEVEFIFPSDKKYEKDREELKFGIEKHCKELIPYNETRFEIAQNFLKPRQRVIVKKEKPKEKE